MNNTASIGILGLEYREVEESIINMATRMIKVGAVTKPAMSIVDPNSSVSSFDDSSNNAMAASTVEAMEVAADAGKITIGNLTAEVKGLKTEIKVAGEE